jgi:hypothetical protein
MKSSIVGSSSPPIQTEKKKGEKKRENLYKVINSRLLITHRQFSLKKKLLANFSLRKKKCVG